MLLDGAKASMIPASLYDSTKGRRKIKVEMITILFQSSVFPHH